MDWKIVCVIVYFILGIISAGFYTKNLWGNRAGWSLLGIMSRVLAVTLLPIIICSPIVMFDEVIVRKYLKNLPFYVRALAITSAYLIFIAMFLTVTEVILKSNLVLGANFFGALLISSPFLYIYDLWSERKKDHRYQADGE